MTEEFRSFFSTSLGLGAVHASDRGVFRIDLPDIDKAETTAEKSAPGPDSSPLTEYVSALLNRYFSGERIEFGDITVDLSALPPFRCKALQVIRRIPYGAIRSYRQIAAECGSPRAARAVGGAMASNPIPIIIPCHRIIGSNGLLTGFSAPGGETLKMMLLQMEGVEFKGLLVMQKQLVMNR